MALVQETHQHELAQAADVVRLFHAPNGSRRKLIDLVYKRNFAFITIPRIVYLCMPSHRPQATPIATPRIPERRSAELQLAEVPVHLTGWQTKNTLRDLQSAEVTKRVPELLKSPFGKGYGLHTYRERPFRPTLSISDSIRVLLRRAKVKGSGPLCIE